MNSKNKPKLIVPVVVVLGVVVFFIVLSQLVGQNNDESSCDKNGGSEYYKGELMGNLFGMKGKTADCNVAIRESEIGTSNSPANANTDCWCEGFQAGYDTAIK